LQHAVRYQEIDQIGTCFSKDVFDPYGYDRSHLAPPPLPLLHPRGETLAEDLLPFRASHGGRRRGVRAADEVRQDRLRELAGGAAQDPHHPLLQERQEPRESLR
jgi:hypothetical protein